MFFGCELVRCVHVTVCVFRCICSHFYWLIDMTGRDSLSLSLLYI